MNSDELRRTLEVTSMSRGDGLVMGLLDAFPPLSVECVEVETDLDGSVTIWLHLEEM